MMSRQLAPCTSKFGTSWEHFFVCLRHRKSIALSQPVPFRDFTVHVSEPLPSPLCCAGLAKEGGSLDTTLK